MAYTTINKSTDYFNTVTYSGTGSAQSITGVGFRPDWLWIKHREDVSNHKLQDVVRGSTKVIGSNETSAEATVAQGVTSFDSDGFSLGTDASVNGTGAAGIVAWNWLAGGSSGSANSDGSISSTVSVNTTAGFSIVSWTGNGSASTIGHGLGVTPNMILLKNRSEVYGWQVYHSFLGNTKYLALDGTDAQATSSQSWNNTSPTSSVFSVGASDSNNKNGNNIIAYCFADKTGYSKFGSFLGNGNQDGAFIYTGFKPAFFLMKEVTDAGTNWLMYDNKRNTSNPVDKVIYPNLNNAEGTGLDFDFLSNGLKCRTSNGGVNGNSNNYIYMCFASAPLVGTNDIPCTAR